MNSLIISKYTGDTNDNSRNEKYAVHIYDTVYILIKDASIYGRIIDNVQNSDKNQ